MIPALIAVDMDGTLLHTDKSISPRTVKAVRALEAKGIPVVPTSGRAPMSLQFLADYDMDRLIVGSNGAVGFDLGADEVVFETTLAPEIQAAVATALTEAEPATRFAATRDHGRAMIGQEGYGDLITPAEVHRGSAWTRNLRPLAEVVSEPVLKLTGRHPTIPALELQELLLSLGVRGFEVTTSGAPFIEIQAEGVTKADGLRRLAELRGFGLESVMAFGDAPNDTEMLSKVGYAVAMGNALPEIKELADEVTLSNNEDGVAVVLERIAANL